MSDCAKCIHCDACSFWKSIGGIEKHFSNGGCGFFKDKANTFIFPCDVGDTVYYITAWDKYADQPDHEQKVEKIVIDDGGISFILPHGTKLSIRDYGKWWFTDKEMWINAKKIYRESEEELERKLKTEEFKMLSNKNQKYLFERLLKGFSVSYEVIDEARIAFTDGVRSFILGKSQIKFDITQCTPSTKLKAVLKDALDGMEFRPSEEIRAIETRGKTYRKLTANNISLCVWIEDKFVKDYRNCMFIYSPHTEATRPVCVLDDYGECIAAIMPCDIDGDASEV